MSRFIYGSNVDCSFGVPIVEQPSTNVLRRSSLRATAIIQQEYGPRLSSIPETIDCFQQARLAGVVHPRDQVHPVEGRQFQLAEAAEVLDAQRAEHRSPSGDSPVA